MDQSKEWLESIVKMIPDTLSAIIIFSEHFDLSQCHNPPIKSQSTNDIDRLFAGKAFLIWPADLPLDTHLLDFSKFAATQENAISCVQENDLFIFSLPVKNADNAVLCHLSIKLSLSNQSKETVVRVIEWAAIWLGHLLQQQQKNHSLIVTKYESSLSADPQITNPQTNQLRPKKGILSDQPYQPFIRWLIGATAVAFVLCVPVNYRISAPATLKGKIESSVIAPFDGFIQEVFVKPGDQVDQAQILAQLDKINISLTLNKLQGDFQEKQKMYRRALVKVERGSAEIYKAQMSQIQSNIDLARQDIRNTQLTSLIKGTVIEGDLRGLIGTPVNKGDLLFKVAPTDEFRVVLNIQESDIRFIHTGQSANLKLISLPGSQFTITLNKPSPIFSESNNQLIYRVEANLNVEKNALFSPGMEGIAKISVGKESIGWYLFHHFVDWIRMHWWDFKP